MWNQFNMFLFHEDFDVLGSVGYSVDDFRRSYVFKKLLSTHYTMRDVFKIDIDVLFKVWLSYYFINMNYINVFFLGFY